MLTQEPVIMIRNLPESCTGESRSPHKYLRHEQRAIRLIDHGNIIVSSQSGKNDEQGQKPLTKDTMYGIGSTSKMFTTAAVMQLVDQGEIGLDTPLVQYLPGFTMMDEQRYRQITPRMLLNHSSGLNGSSMTNTFLFEDNDTYAYESLLGQLAGQTLKADPGAYSVYCNDGLRWPRFWSSTSAAWTSPLICIYFSVIRGKDQVELPAGGSIVFAGDAGTKFEVSAQ
jgi:CubicO group peptidase (beta-lactamase class C family)